MRIARDFDIEGTLPVVNYKRPLKEAVYALLPPEFKVLESQNTRIQAGNTFRCSMIIENEPLYIDHLCQEGMQYAAYICGKKTGVRFERI